jgi:hypothetical protein
MPRMITPGIETLGARPLAPRRCSSLLAPLVFLVGLTGLLTAAAGCRANLPPPPSMAGGTGGGGRGGSAGGGGAGATGGAAGAGGALDTNPPLDDGGGPADAAPTCGLPNQACCPGNRCLKAGCCEQGVCTSYGDVCKLSPGSSCLNGTCSNECGGVMNGVSMKCCSMHNCTSALTVCDSAGPTVGACIACGKAGQPCCADNTAARTYCEGGLACTDGKCPGTAPTIDAAPPTDTRDAADSKG